MYLHRASRVHKIERYTACEICPLIVTELEVCRHCLIVALACVARYISRDPFNSTETNEDLEFLRGRSRYCAGKNPE